MVPGNGTIDTLKVEWAIVNGQLIRQKIGIANTTGSVDGELGSRQRSKLFSMTESTQGL